MRPSLSCIVRSADRVLFGYDFRSAVASSLRVFILALTLYITATLIFSLPGLTAAAAASVVAFSLQLGAAVAWAMRETKEQQVLKHLLDPEPHAVHYREPVHEAMQHENHGAIIEVIRALETEVIKLAAAVYDQSISKSLESNLINFTRAQQGYAETVEQASTRFTYLIEQMYGHTETLKVSLQNLHQDLLGTTEHLLRSNEAIRFEVARTIGTGANQDKVADSEDLLKDVLILMYRFFADMSSHKNPDLLDYYSKSELAWRDRGTHRWTEDWRKDQAAMAIWARIYAERVAKERYLPVIVSDIHSPYAAFRTPHQIYVVGNDGKVVGIMIGGFDLPSDLIRP